MKAVLHASAGRDPISGCSQSSRSTESCQRGQRRRKNDSICLDNLPPSRLDLFPTMHKQNQEQSYHTSRREFLSGTATLSALAVTPRANALFDDAGGTLPPAFSALRPLGSRG